MSTRMCIERHSHDIDTVNAIASAEGPRARAGGMSDGIEAAIGRVGRVAGRG